MTFGIDKNASQAVQGGAVALLASLVHTSKRDYTLVQRTGNIAIYVAPISAEVPDVVMYEVVRVRVANPTTLPSGAVLPWREVYPSPESWGSHGWTYTSASHGDPLQAARGKLASLT